MRRGTAKKHAPESGLIGSVCHPGGALLASSKAPKRTSRAAWSGISLLPKLAMRSMLRRGKKRRPRVKDYVGAIDQGTTSTRSEEHTSELQSRLHLVCRLLLEKKKINTHIQLPAPS